MQVGATPRSPVNQRIRGQACRAATDPVRRCAGTSLNVNHDDLMVGRNQYQHDGSIGAGHIEPEVISD